MCSDCKMTELETKDIKSKVQTVRSISGGIGFLSGLGLGIYRKSGFWGTIGWILLFGVISGTVSEIINAKNNSKLDNK